MINSAAPGPCPAWESLFFLDTIDWMWILYQINKKLDPWNFFKLHYLALTSYHKYIRLIILSTIDIWECLTVSATIRTNHYGVGIDNVWHISALSLNTLQDNSSSLTGGANLYFGLGPFYSRDFTKWPNFAKYNKKRKIYFV